MSAQIRVDGKDTQGMLYSTEAGPIADFFDQYYVDGHQRTFVQLLSSPKIEHSLRLLCDDAVAIQYFRRRMSGRELAHSAVRRDFRIQ